MNKIILFSASWCPKCQFLKRDLLDAGIAFDFVDVGLFPEKGVEHGVTSLPTVLFDGVPVREPTLKQIRDLMRGK